MLTWALENCRTIANASVAGAGVVMDNGAIQWRWVGMPTAPVEDATLRELIAPLLSGDAQGTTVTSSQDRLPERLGTQVVIARAVPAPDNGRRGVLIVGVDAPLDDEAVAVLDGLAAHVGVALDNQEALVRLAELEAAQREVVHQLQEAVRPPQPNINGTELGVYYLPADLQAPTGGDLYDWIVLPNGDLHVAVVDIMGKGVAATKDAVAVTHALRLLVLDGCPLEDLVARTDQLVAAQNPDLVATFIVIRYNPATGELRLAGAGHPPALLISGGKCQEIHAPGIPIGWPGAGSQEIITIEMDRSDTLVVYTDGLVEATKDILAGLESLRQYAEEVSVYPARHLARVLVERALSGATRRDDSLALVLRRRTPPVHEARAPLPPFAYRFSPNLAAVSLARHLLQDWLVRAPAEPDSLDDIVLVASELCANAVRHSSGEAASVALRAYVQGADIVMEVEDDGGGEVDVPPADDDELPDPDAEAGRGLFLVQALTDDFEVMTEGQRTVVRCVKRAVVSTG